MRGTALGTGLVIAGVAVALFALSRTPQGVGTAAPVAAVGLERGASAMELEQLRNEQHQRSEPVIEEAIHVEGVQPKSIQESTRLGTASISGVVRVKGFAPTEPLTLRLLVEGEDPYAVVGNRTQVAGDGTFAFAGFEPRFKGRIQLPRRYALAGSQPRQRSIQVEAPSEGHVLDLERLPALTGRLVARSSGEGIEDAVVQGVLT